MQQIQTLILRENEKKSEFVILIVVSFLAFQGPNATSQINSL